MWLIELKLAKCVKNFINEKTANQPKKSQTLQKVIWLGN